MVLYDAAVAFKTAKDLVKATPLTRVHGKPNFTDMENAKSECMQKLAGIDMTLFPDSHGRYGLSGALQDGALYTQTTTLVYAEMEKPDVYPDDVDGDTDEFERKRREAETATANDAWNRMGGAYAGINELLLEAFDKKYFKKLEQEFIGYAGIHPKRFFEHLLAGPCKMNTTARAELIKRVERGWQWQATNDEDNESVDDFAIRLKREQKGLARAGISYSNTQLIQHYLEQVESHPDIERKDKADFETLCATDDIREDFEAVSEYWEGVFDQMEDFEATRAGAAKKAQYESSQKVEEMAAKQNAIISQSNSQHETILAVRENQNAMAQILQEMRDELKASKAANDKLKAEVAGLKAVPPGFPGGRGGGNENANPNQGGQQGGGGAKCSHCGGRHLKTRPETKCGGYDWPNNAHNKMPHYFIAKVNKVKGTSIKREDLPDPPARDE